MRTRASEERSPRSAAQARPPRTVSSVEEALEVALRLLEFRARSRAELRQRLSRRGAGADAIEAALDRLAAQGYVNDEAFARQWTESRLRTGHGRRRIALELRVKGVAGGTIRETLETLADPEEETVAAARLARQRLRLLRRLEPAAQRRRLYGLLQRRGYAADVIERVLARVVHADGD